MIISQPNCDVMDPEVVDCGKTSVELAVVIPALNEEATIATVVASVPRQIEGIGRIRITVVDDGSSDATAKRATEAGATVVSHPSNLGVGVAFATGLDFVLRQGADVIVTMDGDGQFDPRDIPTLVRPVLHEGYGFATCTRFQDPELVPEMPAIKRWGNRVMCRIVNAIAGQRQFTDVSCGFRAFTRDAALRLCLFGRFTYTHETFLNLAANNVAMTEVPLRVRGVREFGRSRVASSVWRYAVRSVPIILRAMRDTRPLLFFGLLAAAFLALGIGLFAFVGVWWLMTSKTSPWTSLITVGTGSCLFGTSVGILSLVADQLGRNRKLQEQVLYYERKRDYASGARTSAPRQSTSGVFRTGDSSSSSDDS